MKTNKRTVGLNRLRAKVHWSKQMSSGFSVWTHQNNLIVMTVQYTIMSHLWMSKWAWKHCKSFLKALLISNAPIEENPNDKKHIESYVDFATRWRCMHFFRINRIHRWRNCTFDIGLLLLLYLIRDSCKMREIVVLLK